MADVHVDADGQTDPSRIRTQTRCWVCREFLVVLDDPAAREPFGCPNPACPVTDDPSAWMGELE